MTETRGTAASPMRVLYIAGAQHCGSTMLDAILGNAPGARSVGEMGGFHRFEDATACDCRLPPATCEPCRAVLDALGARAQLGDLRRLGPRPLKERRAYWTLFGGRGRSAYARMADTMLRAAATQTGASVLIDSSKNASRAAALAQDSAADVRVVHLVRDGRGYLRSKRRRARADGRRFVPPVELWTWLMKNLLVSAVLRRSVPADRYLLCRYEDLVTDPAAELARIGAFAGLDTSGLAEAATGAGLERRHLFEPRRRVDYRRVLLEPDRLRTPRLARWLDWSYWLGGGFVSSRWGYDRARSYLDGPGAPAVRPES